MLKPQPSFLPKDFIETNEGLCFAVVHPGTERVNGEEKVLCFLRYIRIADDKKSTWQKVSTEQANAYLDAHYPAYQHDSQLLDAKIHAVGTQNILHHHKPRERLQQLLSQQVLDPVEQDVADLCKLFQQNALDLSRVGITGSILLSVQRDSSDIDLVFYDRDSFHLARQITSALVECKKLENLSESDWQSSYLRRGCSLTLTEYVWHERRKYNKALINGRKFDLNFVSATQMPDVIHFQKGGHITVQSKIIDDRYGFDYPALYTINHESIQTVLCFIATYTGQAFIGETVEVCGLLERLEDGRQRIVVGSSREAMGEYIKVIPC